MNTHPHQPRPRNHFGAAPIGASGKRLIMPARPVMSDLQRLEAVVAWEPLWEIVEQLEALPGVTTGQGSGPRRQYRLIDILLMESAVVVEGSYRGAARLLGDPLTWRRLRRAARQAFPNDPDRRLSMTAPSRYQHYRARRDLLNGEMLEVLKRVLRAQAVKVAKGMGMFDPTRGSWSRPDATQCIVGDATRIRCAHRDTAAKPYTGDSRRGGGGGRELVVLTCSDPHRGERVILDAEFKDHRIGTGGNDADHAVGMLQRLLAENGDSLRPGLRGLVYDAALSPDAADAVTGLGVLPIAKTPRSVNGSHQRLRLGSHAFTARDGTKRDFEVVVVNGSPVVVSTDSHGTEAAVPLRHRDIRWWSRRHGRRVLYCRYEMPDSSTVPGHLRGAWTMIRLNGTPKEADTEPSEGRTRMLRALTDADPDFAVLFGARADAESVFADLRRHGRHAHNRRRGRDAHDLWLLAYQILQLASIAR